MKLAVSVLSLVVAGLVLGHQGARAKSPDSDAAAKVDGQVKKVAATESSAETKVAKLGDTAPAWKDLEGTDAKKHSLKDLEKAKAVAVVFTCNTCPVAQAYEDRLIKLSNDYKDKGVALVAINVNKDSSNSLDAMKQRAEKKGMPYEYLFDASQQTARDYGATCTPHAFLLDGHRKIVYAGAIDDDMNADSVKHHSLRDAIDAVLAGKEPTVATTKQFGCGIHYE